MLMVVCVFSRARKEKNGGPTSRDLPVEASGDCRGARLRLRMSIYGYLFNPRHQRRSIEDTVQYANRKSTRMYPRHQSTFQTSEIERAKGHIDTESGMPNLPPESAICDPS